MDVSIFDIVENGVSNSEISKSITDKLKDKYNEEFCVKLIGNRFGTSTDDTVTTFCFPKNDESLLFTATLNKEETILEDDYYIKKLTTEIQENIKKQFKKYTQSVVAKAELMGLNRLNENMDVLDFIDKYKDTNFLAYIVCSENVLDQDLMDIYVEIEKLYNNINLRTLIYFIDESKFEEFYELSNKIPSVTETIINKYNVKNEKIIKIFEKNIIVIK